MAAGTKVAEQLGYCNNEEAGLEPAPPSYQELMASGAFNKPQDTHRPVERRAETMPQPRQEKQNLDRWEDEGSDAETDDWDYASQTIDTRSQATASSLSSQWTSSTAQSSRSSRSERRQERHRDWQMRREQKRAAIEAAVEQAQRRLIDSAPPRSGLKARLEQRLAEKEAKRANRRERHGLR